MALRGNGDGAVTKLLGLRRNGILSYVSLQGPVSAYYIRPGANPLSRCNSLPIGYCVLSINNTLIDLQTQYSEYLVNRAAPFPLYKSRVLQNTAPGTGPSRARNFNIVRGRGGVLLL